MVAESNSVAASNEVTTPVETPQSTESTELPPAKALELAPAVEPAAPTPPAPTPAPAPPAVRQSQYKDGTYQGWGTSRHGDIEATVVIQDGRIASAEISQCRTRYPCSWVSQLPGQVVSRQAPSVDYVSGATQSVNAYYSAVVEALSKAK
jgi:uncharacterized protein with FMN-binding domain